MRRKELYLTVIVIFTLLQPQPGFATTVATTEEESCGSVSKTYYGIPGYGGSVNQDNRGQAGTEAISNSYDNAEAGAKNQAHRAGDLICPEDCTADGEAEASAGNRRPGLTVTAQQTDANIDVFYQAWMYMNSDPNLSDANKIPPAPPRDKNKFCATSESIFDVTVTLYCKKIQEPSTGGRPVDENPLLFSTGVYSTGGQH